MRKIAIKYASYHPMTISRIAEHLSVTRKTATKVVGELSCEMMPGGRVNFVDLLRRLWRLHQIPSSELPQLQRPLLSVKQLAEMAGVEEHTIRRAGNERDPKWRLPHHADLGPRIRRYLPAHVDAWRLNEPFEWWLEPRFGKAVRLVDTTGGDTAKASTMLYLRNKEQSGY
ncbi:MULTISPECIES: hypothetical protein [Thioclava]|nr:hypothetical protein [Thioclava sediminum]